MKQRSLLILAAFIMNTFGLFAQTEPEMTINLLANDKIADVNIDQDKFIKYVGELLDVMKKEFKEISKDQKIAVLVVSHKTGGPSIEFYSKPKIKSEQEQSFLKKINALSFINTKIVDFPILLNANIKNGDLSVDFSDVVLPPDKTIKEYENASLKKKYELNKAWAINEVLPVLSAYQTMVEDKFLGVKNFGTLVAKTNFSEGQDITKLSSTNSDYWRANLEMNVGNQLIPTTKIFMLISQGEFDHAIKYLEVVQYFSDSKTTTNGYLKELSWRMQLFNKELNAQIATGIAEHDKGNYKAAIGVYNGILNDYPNSAWTMYESYYSDNAYDLENKKTTADDRSKWDLAKVKIYKCNPLYNMDVRASNAKEGYLLFRRQEISALFKSKDEKLDDFYKYADISMDLGVYDFAAQVFWYSFTFTKDNQKALNKFLYCIEKLGVTNLKENFKGDWGKEFKKIEKEKQKEMEGSSIYKAFKK